MAIEGRSEDWGGECQRLSLSTPFIACIIKSYHPNGARLLPKLLLVAAQLLAEAWPLTPFSVTVVW
ncbi:hypothetical protein C1H46_022633 [Malus baccata]|uniref:Uncharacterized protein n=1 Tax=Malus baccata TaxID=106549 RepID=A0A540LZ69_MALBA|nr:hypothetical protein C1H46_022633 [Malus baccata]